MGENTFMGLALPKNNKKELSEKIFEITIKFFYINTMEKPLTLNKEEAEVKKPARSAENWKKRQEAIRIASDNGRLWWIEQYLQNVLK